eukprot:RCo010337
MAIPCDDSVVRVMSVGGFEDGDLPCDGIGHEDGPPPSHFVVLTSPAFSADSDHEALERVPQLLKEEGLEATLEDILEALHAVRIAEGSPEDTYDCAVVSR